MMDLQPDRSLIRGLLAHGLDVYLVDWGYPGSRRCGISLDDYVNRYLGACIDHVRKAHDVEAVNLLGVCQGGTMSLCHTALHPARVRNLVTMVTPVDFHTEENLLSKWVRKVDVDRMVDVLGNVPGELLNAAFIALMPLRLTARKYAGLADIADDRAALENFLRMERWIHDSPDQAGDGIPRVHPLVLPGKSAGPGRARDRRPRGGSARDHLPDPQHLCLAGPPRAAFGIAPLEGLTASRDYTPFEFDGGHIGIYVSRSAQELLPRTIAQWLTSRSPAIVSGIG